MEQNVPLLEQSHQKIPSTKTLYLMKISEIQCIFVEIYCNRLTHTVNCSKMFHVKLDYCIIAMILFVSAMGEVCSYSGYRRFACRVKRVNCPLVDLQFLRDIDRFLFMREQLRSVDLSEPKSGPHCTISHFSHFSKKNWQTWALIFGDDIIVNWYPQFRDWPYVNNGGRVTRSKCRQLRAIRGRWLRMLAG